MGTLTRYEIGNTFCNVFIETGTGSDGTLEHACRMGSFEKLYSVEIHKESAEKAKANFANFAKVKIYNDTSSDALRKIFLEIQPSDKAFFFLDAHFPGEHSIDFSGYENLKLSKLTLPLEDELEIIRNARSNSEDIIVIDDLRLYKQGPFDRGNLPIGFGGIPEEMRNIDFVYRLFGDRTIIEDYRDEGYIIILANGVNFKLKRLSAFKRLMRNLRKRLGN